MKIYPFIKKVLTGLGLAATVIVASAAPSVATFSGAGSNLPTAGNQMLTNGYQLAQVIAANSTTNAITFALFDTQYASNADVYQPYTNTVITNIPVYTYIYTNTVLGGPQTVSITNPITGGIQSLAATFTTNYFTNVMSTTNISTAIISNQCSVLLAATVPANTTYTFIPPVNLYGYRRSEERRVGKE